MMDNQIWNAVWAAAFLASLAFYKVMPKQKEHTRVWKKYECGVFFTSTLIQGFALFLPRSPLPFWSVMGGFFILSLICFIHGLYELIKESKQARQEKSNRV